MNICENRMHVSIVLKTGLAFICVVGCCVKFMGLIRNKMLK